MKRYREQNILDVYDAGLRNLRLRCSSNSYPYGENFTVFLSNLTTGVDTCLGVDVMPVVSWADSKSRAYATEENRTNCLLIMVGTGCKVVCRLCFNLFTELSNSHCATKEECSESLASNITKYNHWTEQVIKTIRGVGGHNSKRILIIAPPGYTAKGLAKIDENIYEKDEHLIYHLYASGPNKDVSPRTGQPFKKYWEGCGSEEERKILIDELELARKSIPV